MDSPDPNDLLRKAIDALPAALAVFGPDERLVICNAVFREALHPNEAQIVPGLPFRDLVVLRAKLELANPTPEAIDAFVARRMASQRAGVQMREWTDRNGRAVQMQRRMLADGSTLILNYDIHELREAQHELETQKQALEAVEQSLRDMLHTDDLTGVLNRRAAEKLLCERMESRQASDRPVIVLAGDLDGFKRINDSLGHAAGDTALRKTARRLQANLRKRDTVARMGGDEFLIILEAGSSHERAETLAARLIAAVNEPLECSGALCRVGISLGISHQLDGDQTPDELMACADAALYASKRGGRNQCSTYNHVVRAGLGSHAQLSLDLLDAIERDELVVMLQPIISAADQKIVSAEALVRAQHPKLGMLSPDKFLPIAEELRIMGELDRHVLAKSNAIRRAWTGEHPFPALSVNLSQTTLQDPEFLEFVVGQDIPEGCIAFEILETVYTDDPGAAIQWTLDTLRERGFELALDDFGTGRASINSVIQIKPDRLKIDRSFTENIVEDPQAREVVRLTVALAHALGASVTAEGVETVEQARLLRDLGCDKLQGYLYGRPMLPMLFFRHLEEAPLVRAASG